MFGVIPWRLVGAGALVAAVALMGWRVSVWHSSHKARPGLEKALKAEQGCEPDSRCAERQKALEARQAEVSKEVIRVYEEEIAALRARPVPSRVIRVCKTPSGDLRDASGAQGADGSPTEAGGIHGEVEFDTSPLRDLAREADEVSARLRALQGFNQASQ